MNRKENQRIKYLTVNASDELWGLYITTIGSQIIEPNTSYPPKIHPSAYWFNPATGRVLQEYILLYLTKGSGMFQSRHCKPVEIAGGSLLLLFPNEWHTYVPKKQAGWTEYWVGFNGSNMDSLIDNSFFTRNNPILKVGFNEQLVSLFKQGIEIANIQKIAYQQALAGIVSLLLGISYYSEKNNSFTDGDIVLQINKAKALMQESIYNNMSTESIAASLNWSYSWFRKIFKKYTGFSPEQYRLEIKIQKAKELLTISNMSVKEIAFELNFDSVSYFVKFFNGRVGIPPGEYRNKIKGK